MAIKRKEIADKIYSIAIFAVILIFLILLFSIIRTSIFGNIDEETHIYFEIVFLLLLAVLAEVAMTYTKQQSVVILMVLGILLSPSFMELGWEFIHSIPLPFEIPLEPPEIIKNPEVIHVFAQLGAIILLFKVGLHSKIEKIFSKENLWVAVAGVIFPFIVGYLYASYSGGEFAYSMFVGAALTATSVGVTVAILKELKLLKEKFSQVIIGAAIMDDILSLLVLSIIVNVTTAQGDVLTSAMSTMIIAIIFILGALLAGKYFIEYLDRKEMSARRFLTALAFMLFFAYAAETINLSAIVGAFLAGIILNRSKHYTKLEEGTYSLELLFMPIFFISLGMLVDINAIIEFIIPILIITALAIITKVIGCGGAAYLSKMSLRDSAIVGFGMGPRGEVALIIAAIGLSTAVLSPSEYSIISAMAIITAFIVPPILVHLLKK